MSNARILKKKHTRYLADFLIEASQDETWVSQLKGLELEGKLDTQNQGYPELFAGLFPEAVAAGLQFSLEKVNYTDVPRRASAWWPVEEHTSYFVAYPSQFPQSCIYMAIDLEHQH